MIDVSVFAHRDFDGWESVKFETEDLAIHLDPILNLYYEVYIPRKHAFTSLTLIGKLYD